jgi:hypothetical protein
MDLVFICGFVWFLYTRPWPGTSMKIGRYTHDKNPEKCRDGFKLMLQRLLLMLQKSANGEFLSGFFDETV